MKIYNIIALFILLFSCSKGGEEENKDNDKQPVTENNIIKITLDKKEYVSARNSKIIIEPLIEREVEPSDKDLLFLWSIESEVVSTQRNLDYTIPNSSQLSTKRCNYKVTNKKTNKEQSVEFTLKIVNPFGCGYYFLSEDETPKTQLSYLSTTENSGIVFNTSVIGDVAIGDTPRTLNKKRIYNSDTNNYYELSIVTSKGSYPYIKTNTNTFTLDDKIKQDDFGLNFAPSFHMINTRGVDIFINNGEILSYANNHLYVSTSNGNYNWTSLIHSLRGKHIFTFDKISNKFYQIMMPNGGYLYTDVRAIASCPIMKNEELAGYRCAVVRISEVLQKEEISLLMTATGELNRYKIEDINGNITLKQVKTDLLDGVTTETSIATAKEGIFYIGNGNKIYSLASIDDELKLITTLPTGNDIVKIIVSDDDTRLIVTTYDKKSTHKQKGSIHFIEIKSNKITSYLNTITKCVSIVDCQNSIL